MKDSVPNDVLETSMTQYSADWDDIREPSPFPAGSYKAELTKIQAYVSRSGKITCGLQFTIPVDAYHPDYDAIENPNGMTLPFYLSGDAWTINTGFSYQPERPQTTLAHYRKLWQVFGARRNRFSLEPQAYLAGGWGLEEEAFSELLGKWASIEVGHEKSQNDPDTMVPRITSIRRLD